MPNLLRTFLIRNRVADMQNRDTYRAAVAGEVRAAIARAGRKQSEVGEAAGISRAAMSQKMRGRAPLYIEEVYALAEVLSADPAAWITAAQSGGEAA